jgi:hypothetical protein
LNERHNSVFLNPRKKNPASFERFGDNTRKINLASEIGNPCEHIRNRLLSFALNDTQRSTADFAVGRCLPPLIEISEHELHLSTDIFFSLLAHELPKD